MVEKPFFFLCNAGLGRGSPRHSCVRTRHLRNNSRPRRHPRQPLPSFDQQQRRVLLHQRTVSDNHTFCSFVSLNKMALCRSLSLVGRQILGEPAGLARVVAPATLVPTRDYARGVVKKGSRMRKAGGPPPAMSDPWEAGQSSSLSATFSAVQLVFLTLPLCAPTLPSYINTSIAADFWRFALCV